jgi:hypothetical protein
VPECSVQESGQAVSCENDLRFRDPFGVIDVRRTDVRSRIPKRRAIGIFLHVSEASAMLSSVQTFGSVTPAPGARDARRVSYPST